MAVILFWNRGGAESLGCKKVGVFRMKVVNASKINRRYHTVTQGRESVAVRSLPELFDLI